MELLDKLIKEYEGFQNYFLYETNHCNKLFNNLVKKEDINEDVYYAAKAFTSIVNQIVNRKVEYIHCILAGQIELLSFLNTFDDNYLSHTTNLLESQNCNEQAFIADLDEDIHNIVEFLENFLKSLKKQKQTSSIQEKIQKMIKELEDKKRGEL